MALRGFPSAASGFVDAVLRALRYAPALLVLLLAGAMAYDGLHWWSAARIDRRIRSGIILPDAARVTPEVAFAQGYTLAARGESLRALTRYRQAADVGGPLAVAALYNIGNLHLRQGLAAQEAGQKAQSLALFELAKQSYRDALALEPGYWDAKYNLERTLRLAPDAAPSAPLPGEQALHQKKAIVIRDMPLGPP
jgi:mxaK protein